MNLSADDLSAVRAAVLAFHGNTDAEASGEIPLPLLKALALLLARASIASLGEQSWDCAEEDVLDTDIDDAAHAAADALVASFE